MHDSPYLLIEDDEEERDYRGKLMVSHCKVYVPDFCPCKAEGMKSRLDASAMT